MKKYIATSEQGRSIITVGAASMPEARDEVQRQLEKPGRETQLAFWKQGGERVLLALDQVTTVTLKDLALLDDERFRLLEVIAEDLGLERYEVMDHGADIIAARRVLLGQTPAIVWLVMAQGGMRAQLAMTVYGDDGVFIRNRQTVMLAGYKPNEMDVYNEVKGQIGDDELLPEICRQRCKALTLDWFNDQMDVLKAWV